MSKFIKKHEAKKEEPVVIKPVVNEIIKEEPAKKQFRVVYAEDKIVFEKLIADALNDGWSLGDFTVWSMGASSEHWAYFQTLYK